MKNAFEQLITGLCDLAGHTWPTRVIEGDGVVLDGVTFALLQKSKVDPDAIFVYADFGHLDIEQQAMLYPLMLQENLMMMSSRECTFSVSAVLDSVVMIEKISLSAQTPQTLLALLRSIARRANYFNKHHRAGAAISRPSLQSTPRQNIMNRFQPT